MKFIRLGRVISVIVVVIAIVVFLIVFLDSIIKSVIVSIGESIFGAKVEIAQLKTKITALSITIQQLQIGDKANPMKNIIEIGKIKFGMESLPLLSKKVIVDECTVENMRFQTDRKTSAALPARKAKKLKKEEDKDSLTAQLISSIQQKAMQEIARLPLVKDVKSIQQEIRSINLDKLISDEIENLSSKQLIQTFYTNTANKYEKYKSEINLLNIEQQIEVAKKLTKEVDEFKINSIKDLPKAQEKISTLSEHKKSLDDSLLKLNSLTNSISADFPHQKDLLLSIDDSVNNDYKTLLRKIKLPEFTKGNIAAAIFGQMWLNRVNRAMQYIHLARKYMPQRKKQDKKTLYQRIKGIDVVFHKERAYPNFWLKKMYLSGETPSGILLKGEVNDISSDQKLTGRATKVELSGKQLTNEYALLCSFDRTGEVASDIIQLKMNNLGLTDFTFADVSYLPKLEKALINLDLTFALKNDELNCNMLLEASKLEFGKIEHSTDYLEKIITELLTEVKKITVSAKLYGKKDDLKTSIESNIDEILLVKLKDMYGKEINQLQTQLKAKLNQSITAEKEKLLKEYTVKKDELTQLYTEKTALIQEEINTITQKITELKQEIERIKKEGVKEGLKLFR